MIGAVVALALFIAFRWARKREPRSLLPGALLIAAVWAALVAATEIATALIPGIELVWLLVLALLPLSVIALAVYLIGNGVTMLRRESRGLGNLLSLLLGLALLVGPVLIVLILLIPGPPVPEVLTVALVLIIGLVCSYLGVSFLVVLVSALVYARSTRRGTWGTIVIHGAGLMDGGEVPPLLRGRLQRALDIATAQAGAPQAGAAQEGLPVLIASGGRGDDETRSEASAMAEFLGAQGYPVQLVLQEDRSRTTLENLRFSRELHESVPTPSPMLLVTSDYHTLRTALLARRVGVDAQVSGSRTARYFVPSAFLREFIAIMVMHRVINGIVIGSLVVTTIGALIYASVA